MQTEIAINIRGEELVMSGEKALWWPAKKMLLLADPHFGKSGHFRKKGIAVPEKILVTDLQKLERLMALFKPLKVLFLGDLFHSDDNADVEYFRTWRNGFSDCAFHLVKGNHDILGEQRYLELGLELSHEILTVPPFILKHHPVLEGHPQYYTLSGHVHPGIRLRGKGKQSVRLPCFYFGQYQAILPAFGGFTGLANIRPKPNDRLFAVVEGNVFKL